MAKQDKKRDPLEGVRVLKPSELQRLKGGALPGPHAQEPPIFDTPPGPGTRTDD